MVGLITASISANAGSWCTTISYSAALSSGMNRSFGTATRAGSQGQQCFATQMACESARQSASYGVSSTPCAQQGGSSSPGWSPGSSDSPMSSENYRPDFAPDGEVSTEQPTTTSPLVDAQQIKLPQPWEPPPTCVAKYPWMSDHFDQLLARRKVDQKKLDVHVVACSGIEPDSLVMAACNRESEILQPEASRYEAAVQSQKDKDQGVCERYIASIGNSPDAERKWHSGLACALTDIYTRSRSLGASATGFADQLRQDVREAQLSGPLTTDQDAVAINDTSESMMLSLHKASSPTQEDVSQQIAVDVLVSRHVNDGSVAIQAVSAMLDPSGQRTDEQTTLLVYDRAGHLIGGQYSPAVHRCLSRGLNSAGNE